MASIQLIQNFAVAGFPTLIVVIGTGTSFTGTPFTVSGGTSPSITSQAVDGPNIGRIFLNPGSAAGTLTITDTGSSATATINVRAAAPTIAVTPLPTGAEITYVDPVSGNDSTGVRASRSLPFLTPTAALAVALAGDTVQILPGVCQSSATTTWIVVPANVNLRGSGIGITTLNQPVATSAVKLVLQPGNNSSISDLSVVSSLVAGTTGAVFGGCIGFNQTSSPPFPTNANVQRCSFFGYNDAAYFQTAGGATGTSIWKFRDCQFLGFFDLHNFARPSNVPNFTLVSDIAHCTFTVFGDPQFTHLARGLSIAGQQSGNMNVRISDCTFNVTSGTGASNASAIFTNAAGGGNTINCSIDLVNTAITVATIGSGTTIPVSLASGIVNDLGGNTFAGGTNSATSPGIINTAFGGETTPQPATVQTNIAATFQLDPITGNGGSYVVTVTSANNGVIATVTMGSTTASETFTYTWTSVGTDTLTFTNNGNLGNPPGMAINIIPQVPLAGEVRLGTTFGPDANGATVGGAGGGSISLNNTIIYSLGKTTGNCATFG